MFKKASTWLMLVQVPLAWEWLKAGWDKITEGGFGAKFAEDLPKTLGFFSQQTTNGQTVANPHTWYVNTFMEWAKNNSTVFGYLISYGEFIVGLVLFAAIIYCLILKRVIPTWLNWLVVISLAGAAFMNLNFYLASGWPANAISTRSLNFVMGLMEVILLGYYLTASQEEN